MERAIEYAETLCPAFNLTSMIVMAYNRTAFSNPEVTLPRFLCQYQQLMQKGPTSDYLWAYSLLLGVCVGIPSSVLALLVFFRNDFRTISFFYHRVINAIEL